MSVAGVMGRATATVTIGQIETFASELIDCRQKGTFNEVIKIPVPTVVKGELQLSSQIIDGTGADYLGIEVQVIGYHQAIGTVLATALLGFAAPSLLVRYGGDGRTFDHVAVAARSIVNGLPDGSTLPTKMDLQVSARFEG